MEAAADTAAAAVTQAAETAATVIEQAAEAAAAATTAAAAAVTEAIVQQGEELAANAAHKIKSLLDNPQPNLEWFNAALRERNVTVNDTLSALGTTLEGLNETLGGALTTERFLQIENRQKLEAVLAEHRGHEAMHNEMVLIILCITMAAQTGLAFWRKVDQRSYQKYTLLAMWLVPMLISLYSGFESMLTAWVVFTLVTGWITFKATRKPLHSKTPRLVYRYFFVVYKICFYIGFAGYVGTMFFVLGFGRAFVANKEMRQELLDTCFRMIFYGLYYGCVLRDFAEFCAETMASTIGYYTASGIPKKQLETDKCCVCGDELTGAGDRIVDLQCSHKAHEACLRGWAIVGKKSMCPYCKEKVDLRQLSNSPWKSQDAAFTLLLDGLRYLVAWQPLIIISSTLLIKALDLH